MSLVTRIITNTGAPLYRPNGDIASDVRITFELVNPSGMTVDAWDAETGKRVGSKSVSVTTDAGGEFSVALWPNSRGSEPTKYLCTVHSSGYRPFSGVIEDVPQPLPWAAFMAHGTPLTPQELSQLGQYLDEIEQAKDAAEAAAAGATGAVGAALDAHIAAADPHSQYAKDTDLDAHTGDTDNPHGVTPAQIGADPAGAAAGAVSAHEGAPDPHPQYATAGELGAALDGKVDKVVGMGLSAEDYSAADKIKLSGIEVGAQVNVVTSVAGKTGAVALAKADVGLSNADNTSDADKPVSTATATALSGKVDASDPRLSDAREWTAATVDQAEAEAGTDTRRRAWTAQRVRQAMLGWWGGFAAKATPVDADSIVIADSAASDAPKRLSWANAVAKLKGTFVEGPASSVDGDVMLFDGASGKLAKSGGALGPYATLARQGLPYFNLLASNGRLMGTGADIWSLNNTTASFSIASDYFSANHNGASTASAGKATSNSSTLGGAAAPLPQTLIDWFGMGLHGVIRYFPEFYVAEITQGAAPTIGKRTVGGVDYYTIGYPNVPASYLATGTVTVMLWVRAIDQPAIIISGAAGELRKNLVPVSNLSLINVADGWVHLSVVASLAKNGTAYYFNEVLSIGVQAGAKVQYMLGFVTPGLMPPFKHIMPMLGYRQT